MFAIFKPHARSSSPQIHKINDQVSVAAQIQPEFVKTLADQGFKAIVCNRPDGESRDQPSANEIYQAALKAGLKFAYIPVVPGRISQSDFDLFAKNVKSQNGPVLAYCRTGNRSKTLAQALN